MSYVRSEGVNDQAIYQNEIYALKQNLLLWEEERNMHEIEVLRNIQNLNKSLKNSNKTINNSFMVIAACVATIATTLFLVKLNG